VFLVVKDEIIGLIAEEAEDTIQSFGQYANLKQYPNSLSGFGPLKHYSK